jgi:non-specific serine/threonine protein kinase
VDRQAAISTAIAARLPPQITSFVGRRPEVAHVARLLRTSRLVTIIGTAGLGKTRLAIEVARREAANAGAGAWFVSFAALNDGALVSQELAARLGVSERSGEPLVETLVAHIGAGPMLLVLDNCEHLVGASARLVEALLHGCPRLGVIATSRQPLRVPGEVVWRILPLGLPRRRGGNRLVAIIGSEAVHLFEERANLVQPTFRLGPDNAEPVASICRRLEGIPLAIELAAAGLQTASVEDLLAGLDEGLDLLQDPSPLAIPRHRTLHAALDWSHRLLDDSERRLFRRISVFRGGFEVASASDVCAGEGVELADVPVLVARLVEKSLLAPDLTRPTLPRFGLLETVRQFAGERLQDSGELARLPQRHAEYFLALAQRAEPHQRGPDHVRWLKRLEADHDNLQVALGWCLTNDPPSSLRLAASLTWFWITHGWLSLGTRWLEAALAATGEDAPARAFGLLSMASLRFWQGDYASAGSICDRSLDLYRKHHDELGCGLALTLLGSIHAYQGDYDTSRRRLEEALATVSDRGIRMEALVAIGEVFLQTGDLVQARSRLEEVDAMATGPEAPRGRAALLLGLADFFEADFPAARGHIAVCLDVFQELGNQYAAAAALDVSGALAWTDGDPLRALRLCGAAAQLRESSRGQLAPRWSEVLQTAVIRPATLAAGQQAGTAWAEGRTMTFDEAVRYARQGL